MDQFTARLRWVNCVSTRKPCGLTGLAGIDQVLPLASRPCYARAKVDGLAKPGPFPPSAAIWSVRTGPAHCRNLQRGQAHQAAGSALSSAGAADRASRGVGHAGRAAKKAVAERYLRGL